MSTISRNKSLVIGGFIVTVLVISGIVLANQDKSPEQLTAAKQKWQRNAVSHYRLSLNYSNLDNCQQEVEIKDDKVISRKKNTCSTIPSVQTITDLFQYIESANNQKCGPNGCACDGPIAVNVVYDSQLGYPRQIEMQLQPQKRWLYYNSVEDFYPGRPCTLIGFVNQKISVSEFISSSDN
jgi:Family of unknown function (DUF6174)